MILIYICYSKAYNIATFSNSRLRYRYFFYPIYFYDSWNPNRKKTETLIYVVITLSPSARHLEARITGFWI
jgi:hypothetical protein